MYIIISIKFILRWKKLINIINSWNKQLLLEYANKEPFNDIASWVDEGERLLQGEAIMITRLNTKQIDKSLNYIESTINSFETFFQLCTERREIFYDSLTKTIDTFDKDSSLNQEIIDLLLLLKNRFDDLSALYHIEMSRLLFIQAYYRLLEFLSELKSKLKLWNYGTSRLLTKRWLIEYTVYFFVFYNIFKFL